MKRLVLLILLLSIVLSIKQDKNEMNAQLIRSATVLFNINGVKFIIDPWLADKETMEPFLDPLTERRHQFKRQPICDLPYPAEEVIKGLNFTILTHSHTDHFDYIMNETGFHYIGIINKSLPLFVQNEDEQSKISKDGFTNIKLLTAESQIFKGIEIIKTPGRHGTKEPCGPASGVILKANNKTIYVAGDTIYYEAVTAVILKYNPDYIFVNSCSAELEQNGRLIMDANDVIQTAKLANKAKVICVHMENVSHANLNRTELRHAVNEAKVNNVMIPNDGEIIDL